MKVYKGVCVHAQVESGINCETDMHVRTYVHVFNAGTYVLYNASISGRMYAYHMYL